MIDRLMRWAGYAVALNWLSWFAITFYIGGDAPSGQILAGRYYVSSHAILTEVSRSVYVFSMWHTYLAWGGLLAYLVVGLSWKGRAFWEGRARGKSRS
jgi:hypothetical protein